MTWFQELMGFEERSPQQVRQNISLEGDRMISHANKKGFGYGRLETPSLQELRERVARSSSAEGRLSISEAVADVGALHAKESNAGVLFQVASQFNLLEMTGPEVTPEEGVGRYEYDFTQGPTCAIAAGAGTIYRNYFVNIDGKVGQTEDRQMDCIADLGEALGNDDDRLWTMRNGYALATREGLVEISERLENSYETELDELRGLLRIGLHWNTQVTIADREHEVHQAYCSALPVSYSDHPSPLWEGFARLILEASYEATICSALLNAANTGNDRVYLTLLGGGAFGNESLWITESIERALSRYTNRQLELVLVSYGRSNPELHGLIERIGSR